MPQIWIYVQQFLFIFLKQNDVDYGEQSKINFLLLQIIISRLEWEYFMQIMNKSVNRCQTSTSWA